VARKRSETADVAIERETTDAATPLVQSPPTLPPDAILLPVTSAQLAACLERQHQALTRTLTEPNAPPIDGGLGLITANIDALRRVVPTLPDKKDETQ
jgi:hypothetical protein